MSKTECDVLIIGAGITGSIAASILKKNYNVIVVEKRSVGSHDPSYYIAMDILERYDLTSKIQNIINAFSYDTDNGLETHADTGKGSFGNLNYRDMCNQLLKGVTVIFDSFSNIDLDKSTAEFDSGNIINFKVLIDATGWESPVRKNLGLIKPVIGPHTVLLKIENCNIKDPNLMIFNVGDIASFGYWMEPISETEVLAGTGYWDYLDTPSNLRALDQMIKEYIDQYPEIFSEAIITGRYYAKIGADPVKDIVYKNMISLGESAGQANPYWCLGAGKIIPQVEYACEVISKYLTSSGSLQDYQNNWEKSLKNEYQSLWARGRVIWNFGAEEWKYLLSRRLQTKSEIDPDKVAERMDGRRKYGLLYSIKTLGIKNIVNIFRYKKLFKRRLNNDELFTNYKFKFRSPSNTFNFNDYWNKEDNIIKLHEKYLLLH